MVELTTTPQAELVHDLAASYADMAVCRMALRVGIIRHQDGFPVQERLDTNKKVAALIIGELARRAFNGINQEVAS